MRLMIRRAGEADASEIAEMEALCFSTPWSRDAFLHELTQNELALYLVAVGKETGRLVGYAGIWRILDEGHITNVAVHPAYREKGIGRQLVKALLLQVEAEGALRQTLEVRASNDPAIGLYISLGFQEAGRRKGYYEDNGEDAIIMWRQSNTRKDAAAMWRE